MTQQEFLNLQTRQAAAAGLLRDRNILLNHLNWMIFDDSKIVARKSFVETLIPPRPTLSIDRCLSIGVTESMLKNIESSLRSTISEIESKLKELLNCNDDFEEKFHELTTFTLQVEMMIAATSVQGIDVIRRRSGTVELQLHRLSDKHISTIAEKIKELLGSCQIEFQKEFDAFEIPQQWRIPQ